MAERSGCRNKCDTDRNCVSFGWEKTKKTCHVSSTCTEKINTVKNATVDLYVKGNVNNGVNSTTSQTTNYMSVYHLNMDDRYFYIHLVFRLQSEQFLSRK